MVATDIKGRAILTEQQAAVVAIFLAQVRGTLQPGGVVSADDWLHTRQALLALARAGWAIIPQSQLDGWKHILSERDTVVNGAYMDAEPPEKST